MANALNGAARVNFLSIAANGQAISNSFHLWDSGAGSSPDYAELAGLATDIQTYLAAAYEDTLTTGDTLSKITCYQVADPSAPEPVLEAAVFPNHVGTLSPSPRTTPMSVAGCIQLKTPVASKRYRGHMLIAGAPANSDLSANKFATGSAWWPKAVAWAAKLATGCAPTPSWTGSHLSTYELSIYSKVAQLAGDPGFAPCTAVIVDPLVHWLRSRERGSS